MQSHFITTASILLVVIVAFCAAAPMIEEPKLEKPTNLEILFAKIVKKQNESKQHRLINFISRAMPGGVDAPIASMAEYETFKSDKSANFLSDGAGHVVFRQYRRARLSDILHNVNRRAGGV
ncbi:DUF5380 domain-containing protein [Caenorhabditis elegans]|uniref:Uncharacterized protein F46C5.1 n=1 Tax=Caenorhabditis elegans TaxID=6239 RepID=YAF1_CAEEL|nr:Uncharacterized protein CELE_F46C5.1 [Caenorhabditis elegans]P52880.1 RecName: Full=Uncharacterized protein F46C5.1 [Caenorhabditis elegans]CAA91048.1 Uncharacterized protein CELE_F46C5.1 [Caenorhabditis elegans]|eukprot:NP_495879.1 Uncharacterized protein CELE_F46C5.1 [Caenorhabditis elegans]